MLPQPADRDNSQTKGYKNLIRGAKEKLKLGGRTQVGALDQRLITWMPETPHLVLYKWTDDE